jgi:Zn-dependent protease with chaperone function
MRYDDRLPAEGINSSPENSLREFALLVGGLVALAVACIAIAALALDRLVPLVPPELEARWLGGFGALVEQDDDPRVAPVQALLDRLAAHWSDQPYPFRVGVLDEGDPNALALPGGAILVTNGLLEQVASENELALVLGHELGHYHARDHLRGLGRALAFQLVIGALGGEQIVTGLAGFAGALAQRGFDRRQESEADAFGLALLHAEYGHVAGAGDFFARLAEQVDEAAPPGRLASYLDTHPLHADRAAALRAEADARGWANEGPLTPWAMPPAE